MNRIIGFLVLFAVIASCEKNENSPNDIDNNFVQLDTFIVNNYTRDAKAMYFHEIITDSSHSNFNNPILDTTEVTKILRIIQAVYNYKTPQTDTVFNLYQIHGGICYSLKFIVLKVTIEPAEEIVNLSNGIIPTGDKDLDNILTTYHFDSVRNYGYPNFPYVGIWSHVEYNLIPIEKEFRELPQIIKAETNKVCWGRINEIRLTRNNAYATITFSQGFGDCPAGCFFHRHWEFKVTHGVAEFVRTFKDTGGARIYL